MNDHNEKHVKSSLKDEIIGIIQHDEVDALIQKFLGHARKTHRAKTWINSAVIILSVLFAVGAFILTYHSDSNQTLLAIQRAYDQQQALHIETTIQRKIEWFKKINAAVINMRNVRYDIVLQCRYHKPISAYQQALLRWNALVIVINAFAGSRFVFNDALQQKSFELTSFDESVKDVCSKNAPHDTTWRDYSTEIDNIMGHSILEDQDKLDQQEKNTTALSKGSDKAVSF